MMVRSWAHINTSRAGMQHCYQVLSRTDTSSARVDCALAGNVGGATTPSGRSLYVRGNDLQ